jgi:hypothetical protein
LQELYQLLGKTRSLTFKNFPFLAAGSKEQGCIANCCQSLQHSPEPHYSFTCSMFSMLLESTVISTAGNE